MLFRSHSNSDVKEFIETVINLAEEGVDSIQYEYHYIFLDILKFKFLNILTNDLGSFKTSIEIDITNGTFYCPFIDCKRIVSFKRSFYQFRNHILQKHSAKYCGHDKFSQYLNSLSRQKGFESYPRYRDHFAQKKGFENYTKYRQEQIKENGYKDHYEYLKDLARRKGYQNLAEYNRYLIKRKGFDNIYDYNCGIVKTNGRTCKRHKITFYSLTEYNRHIRKEHRK